MPAESCTAASQAGSISENCPNDYVSLSRMFYQLSDRQESMKNGDTHPPFTSPAAISVPFLFKRALDLSLTL